MARWSPCRFEYANTFSSTVPWPFQKSYSTKFALSAKMLALLQQRRNLALVPRDQPSFGHSSILACLYSMP